MSLLATSDGDVQVYVTAALDDNAAMELYLRGAPDDAISIFLGRERVRLEFYDVASLERLRDLADQGARRLRVALDAITQPDAEP